MESIRLYAFRVSILSFLLLGAISCSSDKKSDDLRELSDTVESNDDQGRVALDGSEYKIYVSRLLPVDDNAIIDLRYKFIQYGYTCHEILQFDTQHLYSYDPTRNSFLRKYKIETEYKEAFDSADKFYIVDNKLIKNYGDSISPNTGVPIYKHGDFYISLYKKKQLEHAMVYSTDLIHWTVSSLECPAPIVFFEKGSDLFALAANKVWNISNPEEPAVVKELPETILRPLPGDPYYAVRDETIFNVFNMDNHLFAYVDRIYEDGPQRYFLVLNTDDFTYTLSKVTEEFQGPYMEKAVKSDDGWKLYFISTEKILVVDPFTEGGPKVIDELPGSLN